MPIFDFHLPNRILFGPGRLSDLEHTPYLPKGSRALIVVGAGGSMLTEGHLARVQMKPFSGGHLRPSAAREDIPLMRFSPFL